LALFFIANHRFFSGDVFLAKLKAHCSGTDNALIAPSLVILRRLHEGGTAQVQAAVRAAVDLERLSELWRNGDAVVHWTAKKLGVLLEGEGSYDGKKYMGLLQKQLHEAVGNKQGSGYASIEYVCIVSGALFGGVVGVWQERGTWFDRWMCT
jgi:hypothetical protein